MPVKPGTARPGRAPEWIKEFLAFFIFLALVLAFYWKQVFAGQILVSYDLLTYAYPRLAYAADALRQGHLPLWNPYLFMGVPFLADIQTGVFYPFNLLGLFLDPPYLANVSIVIHVFLGGVFTYALGRISLGLGRLGAMMAGITFMLSGGLLAKTGHLDRINTTIWLPLLLMLFHLGFVQRRLLFALLGGVVVGLQLLASHPQEAFINLFALGLFATYLVATEALGIARYLVPLRLSVLGRGIVTAVGRSFWAGVLLLLMTLLGAGLTAVQMVPTAELLRQSLRLTGWSEFLATSFSLPPNYFFMAFLPPFGDSLHTEFVAHVGIVPLILAFWGLWRGRGHRYVPYCLFLISLALFLALGSYNPLNEWVYRLPILGSFRVPPRWLALYTLGVSLLAGVGIHYLVQDGRLALRRVWWRGLLAWVLGTGIISGVLVTAWQLQPFFPLQPLWGVLLWGGLGTVAVAIVAAPAWGAPCRPLAIIALVISGAELFFGGQFLGITPVPPQGYTSLRPALAQVMTDDSLFRILSIASTEYTPGDMRDLRLMLKNLIPKEALDELVAAYKYKETFTPNTPALNGIATIDGYNGGLLPLGSYLEFKKLLLDSGGLREGQGYQPDTTLRTQLVDIPDSRLLGALNVKYVIMDKRSDAWLDGTYYDLSLERVVAPETSVFLRSDSPFQATSLGLITYLSHTEPFSLGEVVARVVVRGEGETVEAVLRAGQETALGSRDVLTEWVLTGANPRLPFRALIPFPRPLYVDEVEVQYLAPQGRLHIVGASLIDQRNLASQSLPESEDFRIVHDGDTKVYLNLNWLPRAYLVHQAQVVPENTLDAIKEDIQGRIILSEGIPLSYSLSGAGQPLPGEEVTIQHYHPEWVQVAATLEAPGFLILSDTFYPGWRAWVDGTEVAILRANHLFRGTYLSPGRHLVEFRYQPYSLTLGMRLTQWSLGTLSVGLLFVLLAWVIRRSRG
ncbi:MAG: YfhO family protein [Chloroflexi bacterium]|nr:YfhO family protein [Chloroflexota bacterium]